MRRVDANTFALSLLALLSLTFTLTGCKEEASWKSRSYSEKALASTVGEIKIPSELWERVIAPDRPLKELLTLSSVPTPNQGGGASAIAKATVETDLKPLTVYMIEETHGVLGGRNQKIVFGPGGGDIDLRDFVVEKHGAFRIAFEFGEDADPKAPKRVWYLSNALHRRIGPDWVGAGCDTFMDVSSFVKSEVAKDGLLFAVAGDRHVSALAGTFLFSLKRGTRVEVSRVTFSDSSRRKLECRPRGDS
ncbi:hypothetical protein BH10BDE1_BH10BDE1_07020 [soil metagenome]